jgi:hypothetical protein
MVLLKPIVIGDAQEYAGKPGEVDLFPMVSPL